jgi:ribosomal protein L24
VTPQCHLGFFSVLTQEPSFHISKVEHEAPNQCKNERSTKFISKESCLKQMRFSKRGKNVQTLIPTLIKLIK